MNHTPFYREGNRPVGLTQKFKVGTFCIERLGGSGPIGQFEYDAVIDDRNPLEPGQYRRGTVLMSLRRQSALDKSELTNTMQECTLSLPANVDFGSIGFSRKWTKHFESAERYYREYNGEEALDWSVM